MVAVHRDADRAMPSSGPSRRQPRWRCRAGRPTARAPHHGVNVMRCWKGCRWEWRLRRRAGDTQGDHRDGIASSGVLQLWGTWGRGSTCSTHRAGAPSPHQKTCMALELGRELGVVLTLGTQASRIADSASHRHATPALSDQRIFRARFWPPAGTVPAGPAYSARPIRRTGRLPGGPVRVIVPFAPRVGHLGGMLARSSPTVAVLRFDNRGGRRRHVGAVSSPRRRLDGYPLRRTRRSGTAVYYKLP